MRWISYIKPDSYLTYLTHTSAGRARYRNARPMSRAFGGQASGGAKSPLDFAASSASRLDLKAEQRADVRPAGPDFAAHKASGQNPSRPVDYAMLSAPKPKLSPPRTTSRLSSAADGCSWQRQEGGMQEEAEKANGWVDTPMRRPSVLVLGLLNPAARFLASHGHSSAPCRGCHLWLGL